MQRMIRGCSHITSAGREGGGSSANADYCWRRGEGGSAKSWPLLTRGGRGVGRMLKMLTMGEGGVEASDEHIVWWYIVIPNIVSFSKYRINIVIAFFLDNITRYLIMYYWSILAFHGPVKAKWLLKFRMIWPITAWIGVIYAFVIHLKNEILCIVRSFHEFHENVVIFATYAHILPNEKYRVISCDYRIKTQNIV